ncbi:unnamed protein product [Symbiodinium microadriaticum]|nr:unnamed protein product [Symbiodinium sp. KB8]CAE7891248.1 unnamed protein product [Symbiodinium microadriaticum]
MDGSSEDARSTAAAASSLEGQASVGTRIFEINVKQIDGSTTPVTVRSSFNGWALKQLLAEKLGVPADRQRLICRGRAIQDRKTNPFFRSPLRASTVFFQWLCAVYPMPKNYFECSL